MKWNLDIGRLSTRVRTTLTPKGAKLLRWFLPFIPLVFLAIDFAVFPVLIETSDPNKDVTGSSLISKPPYVQYLGNYKAHRIYVSLDDIYDDDYLPFITKGLTNGQENGQWIWGSSHHSNTALVLSISRYDGGWSSLEWTRLLAKLNALSPDDHDRLIDLVRDAPLSENVLWYDFKSVSSSLPATSSLPLDHLVILKFQSQHSSVYSTEIREMLETAGKRDLSMLVLPCLPSAPLVENTSYISCGDTYQAFFPTLEPGGPPKIFLSLEKNWLTNDIRHSVESIKENWKSAIKLEPKSPGTLPTLYQSDIRLLLLFLPVCLMVCSFRIVLTLKNYVIVCIAFVATGLEVQERLAPLLYDLAESTPAWIFKCALLAVLSGGFLFFAGLDLEGVFRGHHDNPL